MLGWLREHNIEVAIVLLVIAAVLLLALCILCAIFCRKREGGWSDATMLPVPLDDSACHNDGFDFADETSARRIEERRLARLSALSRDPDPRAELMLNKMDRSVGQALAASHLMHSSYVFDTGKLHPQTDIEVLAAKRDYL